MPPCRVHDRVHATAPQSVRHDCVVDAEAIPHQCWTPIAIKDSRAPCLANLMATSGGRLCPRSAVLQFVEGMLARLYMSVLGWRPPKTSSAVIWCDLGLQCMVLSHRRDAQPVRRGVSTWRAYQRAGSTAASLSLTASRCAPSPRATPAPIPDSASSARRCSSRLNLGTPAIAWRRAPAAAGASRQWGHDAPR